MPCDSSSFFSSCYSYSYDPGGEKVGAVANKFCIARSLRIHGLVFKVYSFPIAENCCMYNTGANKTPAVTRSVYTDIESEFTQEI